MAAREADIAILGGGLAGGLIALALAERQPELDVVVVEQGQGFGGNRVWSFFGPDVRNEDRWLLERLVVHGWRGYDVAFPGHRRTLPTTLYSITSGQFDYELRQTLPPRALLTGQRVVEASATEVRGADGLTIAAGAVIDARGARLSGELTGGWRKFAGVLLALAKPHGLERPILIDATGEQMDGFRFVTALPVSDSEVFVEDVCYSDSTTFDRDAAIRRIERYCGERGWEPEQPLGEAYGVVPLISGGDLAAFRRAGGSNEAKAGTRAGLLHPLTGHPLPLATRFATALAARRDLSAEGIAKFSADFARDAWAAGSFARKLVAMQFGAGAPIDRYKVFESLYRQDRRAIERTFAGRPRFADKWRIAAAGGVPLGQRMGALLGRGGGERLRHGSLRGEAG